MREVQAELTGPFVSVTLERMAVSDLSEVRAEADADVEGCGRGEE